MKYPFNVCEVQFDWKGKTNHFHKVNVHWFVCYRSLDLALFNSSQVYLYSAFYDTIVAKRFLTVCVCYSKSSTLI